MQAGKRDATISFVSKTVRTFDPDPAHNKQVTLLSLALFDGLRPLHRYGRKERLLLMIAARLHDIGWSRAVAGKHHKRSAELIQDLDIPGLGRGDRLMCALIARYHTKALPDAARHRRFASLNGSRREVVEWLAGILRLADGLDCLHESNIKGLTCTVNDKEVIIHLEAKGDIRMELKRAGQKQDLLAKKTGRKINYQC